MSEIEALKEELQQMKQRYENQLAQTHAAREDNLRNIARNEGEIRHLRERLKLTAQTIIAAIGSNGPENADEAALRIKPVLDQARAGGSIMRDSLLKHVEAAIELASDKVHDSTLWKDPYYADAATKKTIYEQLLEDIMKPFDSLTTPTTDKPATYEPWHDD